MKFLVCFLCFLNLICSLSALPVNQESFNEFNNQLNSPYQHPYHTGLIRDYNSHQKFEYKFTDLQVVKSSPNEHQSLPLTVNGPIDNFKDNKRYLDDKSRKSNENKKDNLLNTLKKSTDQLAETPSAILSDIFTRVNKRYMDSNFKSKGKLRSLVRKQQDRLSVNQNQEICPESSFSNVNLDPVSKAYLAPILFSGKLSSLSEDYEGRVAATFRVLRVIKTSTIDVKDQFSQTQKVPIQLEKGHQVVLYFVRKPGERFIPPHCAVWMNSSSIGSLRLEQKYFVYAAAPVQSLQEMHQHSFGSVTYKAEVKEELVNSTADNLNDNLIQNSISNLNNSQLNESSIEETINRRQNETTVKKVNKKNLVWMNDRHFQIPSKLINQQFNASIGQSQQQVQMQFIIHYLSAFYTPEPFSKNISRSIAKALCKKCAKKPQIEGFNGDLRVQEKNRLRLRCKIFGSPQPWVDWYRNGKKLRNKGRISIKTTKKLSKLEINRVESSDSGYYECRVQNVASTQPLVAKTRVIVVLNQRTQIKPKKEKTTTTTAPNLWPLIGQPCPMNNFCLNGGVCTFFENVYEYVCQCAPGYRGLRCQEKDISLNESHSVIEFNSALKTGV